MRRIASIIFLWLLLAADCLAQTNGAVTVQISSFQMNQPVVNRLCQVRYLSYPGVGLGGVVAGDQWNVYTDTNGQFVMTNPATGVYGITITAPPQRTYFAILITNQGNINVNATNILVASADATFPVGSVAWAAGVTDGRYAPIGASPTNLPSVSAGNSAITIATNVNGSATNYSISAAPGGSGTLNNSQFFSDGTKTNLGTNQVFGGLTATSNLFSSNSFTGNLTVSNQVNATGTVMAGALVANTTIVSQGNTTIGGAASVIGNATIGGNETVNGNLLANGNVILNNTTLSGITTLAAINVVATAFTGAGTGLTSIPASQLAGTIPYGALPSGGAGTILSNTGSAYVFANSPTGSGSGSIYTPQFKTNVSGQVELTNVSWNILNQNSVLFLASPSATSNGFGKTNVMAASYSSTIGGEFNFSAAGQNNQLQNGMDNAEIGGTQNIIVGGNNNSIMGGQQNGFPSSFGGVVSDTIIGGFGNQINDDDIVSGYSSILGGVGGSMLSSGSSIIGGLDNVMGRTLNGSLLNGYGSIIAGVNNTNEGYASIILGGESNWISHVGLSFPRDVLESGDYINNSANYVQAFGSRISNSYPHNFAWSDGSSTLNPPTSNTFNILASGGFNLNGATLSFSNSVGVGALIQANNGSGNLESLQVNSNGVEIAGINQFGHYKAHPGSPSHVAFGIQGNGTNGIYFPSSNAVSLVNNGKDVLVASNGTVNINASIIATNLLSLPFLTNTQTSPVGIAITNPASQTAVNFLTNGSTLFGSNVTFNDVNSHTFLNPSNYTMSIFQGNPNKWLLMLAYSNGVLYHFAPTGFGAIGNDTNDFVYIAVEDGHAQSNALYMIIDPTNGAIIDALSKTGNSPRLNILSQSNIDMYAAAAMTFKAVGGHFGFGISNFTSQSWMEASNNTGGYMRFAWHNGGGTGGQNLLNWGVNGSVGQSIPNDVDSFFTEYIGAGPMLYDDFNSHGFIIAQNRAGVFAILPTGNTAISNSLTVGGQASIQSTLSVGGISQPDVVTINVTNSNDKGMTITNGTNWGSLRVNGANGNGIANQAYATVLQAATGPLVLDSFAKSNMIFSINRLGAMAIEGATKNVDITNSLWVGGQGQFGTKLGIGMAPKDLLDIHGANNGLIMSVVTNDNATSGTDYVYLAQAGTSPGFNNGADVGLLESRGIGGTMISSINGPMFFNVGSSRTGAMMIDTSRNLWISNSAATGGQLQVGTKLGVGMAPIGLMDLQGNNAGLIRSRMTNANSSSSTDYLDVGVQGPTSGVNNGSDTGWIEAGGVGGLFEDALNGPLILAQNRIGALVIDSSQNVTISNNVTSTTSTNIYLGFKTNNPFTPGTLASGAGLNWTNLTANGFGRVTRGGSVRISGSLSATLSTSYAVIAVYKDGTRETNDTGDTAITAVTPSFTNTLQIPINDSNSIVYLTNTGGTTLTIVGSTMK